MLVGLDVGGTHTDAVLVDKSGVVAAAKVITRHDNLLESVNEGIRRVIEGADRDGIERINLSTTLSTNAIVEGKTETTGMLVSAGPGVDPGNYRIGDYYFPLAGSIDHRGTEVLPVDEKGLAAAMASCRKAGIRVYAAVGKFSTRNPRHEKIMGEGIGDEADFVTLGHALSGRLNFPRRIATAYYNSAVWRLYNGFADAVEQSMQGYGLKAQLHILKADGGTMPVSLSKRLPVETILSGPAASVMGIVALCRITRDSVILDIGGTTTDIAVFASGSPLVEPDGIALDSRLTLVRALKTRSVGIGGDSEIRREGERIVVGPQRRGASMAFGGQLPTLTDAFNAKGISACGDVGRSRDGIGSFARDFGLTPEALSSRAVEYAVKKIKDEVDALVTGINERPVYTIHELLEGKKVVPEALYVMGGPAKDFAALLSDAFKMEAVVPENYAVANAVGAALARTTMYLELLADTEKGRLLIPDIGVSRDIPPTYSLEEAEADAKKYLLGYLRNAQVGDRHIEAEIVDSASFSMVQGFYTSGRNIRVKCQVKPGVLQEYGESVRGA